MEKLINRNHLINGHEYAKIRMRTYDDHIRMRRLIRAVVKIDTIVRITLHVLLCILWMIDRFREQLD